MITFVITMKDRITKIMTHLGLSATRLADEIGVQRSSISHIISGRNKPSYDFIVRMLEQYPSINALWLITGKGQMINNTEISEKPEEKSHIKSVDQLLPIFNTDFKDENTNEYDVDKSKQQLKVTNVNLISGVILLFSDGTFVHYKGKN
jgi:plasmid maintenance system antidote protein VapI